MVEREGGEADGTTGDAGVGSRTSRPRLVIVAVVVVAFAVLLAGKTVIRAPEQESAGPSAAAAGGSRISPAAVEVTVSPSSAAVDAVSVFDEARASGKPVYVLFHWLTCQSCVEISAVVDQVMPEYEGKVAFVNAITDEPRAKELASRFRFQYIPTSFFIAGDGTIVESYTGSMDAAAMRARLEGVAGR